MKVKIKLPLMFVPHKFVLPDAIVKKIRSKTPNFGYSGFGELVYYRTYSRKMSNGQRESWHDTIFRVSAGVFSILKSHLLQHHLPWDQEYWEKYAEEFTEYMFDMKFLPPGRGLWAMGTDFVNERGSMSLNNCAFVSTENLVESARWTMDALMNGCGVGFNTNFSGNVSGPGINGTQDYIIEDSREGWVNSTAALIESYISTDENRWWNDKKDLIFDYSKIRGPGIPIKGFGGISSGPDPLIKLHKRLRLYLSTRVINKIWNGINGNKDSSIHKMVGGPFDVIERIKINLFKINGEEFKEYAEKSYQKYTNVRLVADIFNAIGSCVVAGNIRRSSEIALGDPSSNEFIHLKDLTQNPERSDIYWMSNNTVQFKTTDDFKRIPAICEQIIKSGNGEPGIYNMLNVQNYGRVNKHYDPNDEWTREREKDLATGVNPCGEIPLESYELCNLAEVFPSRCSTDEKFNHEIFYKTVEYATFYASVVSLLPTHSSQTNKVLAKNHRIGVSLSGTVLVSEQLGYSGMIDILKTGYHRVRDTNNKIMDMAGVPRSIRVTTIKPSGTVSKLAGVPEGIHFPIGNRYIIRRIRVSKNDDLVPYLTEHGVPYEVDKYADNTLVFEFPIDQGDTRSINQVSMWEQLKVAELFQRWWSDNSVSITINYDQEEAKVLEEAISSSIYNIKTLSFAPKSDIKYEQAPVEAITYEKYLQLKEKMGTIDLRDFLKGSEGKKDNADNAAPRYCDNEQCSL